MYELDTEPKWLPLTPGVKVLFAPVSRRAYRAARKAAAAAILAGGDDADGDAADAFSAALISAGIVDWEGIGDAKGKPLPVTPEAKAAFLKDPRLFDAADREYVGPWVERDREKNASAPSPAGTSAGATAEKATARTAKASARPARTRSTGPKPGKAKPPGK